MNDELACKHRWKIAEAQGGVPSEGVCFYCGDRKLFTNSLRQKVKLVEGDASPRVVSQSERDSKERLSRAREMMAMA